MHWTNVQGVRMPKLLGGHPALDFCNTWAGWNEPPDQGGEYLSDYDSLVVWCRYADLLDARDSAHVRRAARRDPDAAAHTLTKARELRTSIYDVVLHPFARSSFRLVADLAGRANASTVLTRDRTGVARWVLPTSTGLEQPLLAVARSAVELICSQDRLLVRACPGPQCGWVFLDRRGRRRWCSMSSCGNRAKVRTHAARHRTS
jgi:predicted RNA-binding Zn ribbon-like protein